MCASLFIFWPLRLIDVFELKFQLEKIISCSMSTFTEEREGKTHFQFEDFLVDSACFSGKRVHTLRINF